MCPAQVYEAVEGGVEVAASNCVQCGAITAKGGRLTPPEGGSGPEYTLTVTTVVTRDDELVRRRPRGERDDRRPPCTAPRSSARRRSSSRIGPGVFLKAELFQKTGSFKPRGMLNELARLTDEEKQRGVITISAGNPAQALAYGSAAEGIDACVVMWKGASEAKLAATREYGAAVDLEAAAPAEAFERLAELRDETGRTLVHPSTTRSRLRARNRRARAARGRGRRGRSRRADWRRRADLGRSPPR